VKAPWRPHESIEAPCPQHQLGSVLGEATCRGLSQTAASSGDNDYLVFGT
jgi:hypothetical protein